MPDDYYTDDDYDKMLDKKILEDLFLNKYQGLVFDGNDSLKREEWLEKVQSECKWIFDVYGLR